ncbi:hypothetical protein L0657_24570 [Dyadobacter sp. CY345]|uniref:hypothetical protein n=1 Tax=Dyadobacter sp. CY345 TaxID=2909335 RepID=UPI001F44016C|nr:hypothetical protein [Dyadobacter sp. CY345]MCF2447151.1 hypothetical protein [Dyadobacter sp. CY345]
MKKIAVIGLLVLLLYNMFGLTTAILLFDNKYESPSTNTSAGEYELLKVYMPSLPYSSDWENTEGLDGLIKSNGQFYNATHVKHTNDTLYVTVKSNQAARDHFFELADRMQSLADQTSENPENQKGKAMKILDNLLKNYVQNQTAFVIFQSATAVQKASVNYPSEQVKYMFWVRQLRTPPPENLILS